MAQLFSFCTPWRTPSSPLHFRSCCFAASYARTRCVAAQPHTCARVCACLGKGFAHSTRVLCRVSSHLTCAACRSKSCVVRVNYRRAASLPTPCTTPAQPCGRTHQPWLEHMLPSLRLHPRQRLLYVLVRSRMHTACAYVAGVYSRPRLPQIFVPLSLTFRAVHPLSAHLAGC